MVANFLFELGCEELPSSEVYDLGYALHEKILDALKKQNIGFQFSQFFATPRRLAIQIESLQEEQPPVVVTKRGPAVAQAYDSDGNPTKALMHFAQSCGVEYTELNTLETEKGQWVVHESTTPAIQTQTCMPLILEEALRSLPIKKRMRYGNGDIEFARPIHWIVMLWNDKVIPCSILGYPSGSISYGHRFHHPEAITIGHIKDYKDVLEKAYVIADFAERKKRIIKQVEELAHTHGWQPVMPDSLLHEITSIVEWPKACLVPFSEHFLLLPKEIIIASMHTHQKCIPLLDKNGHIQPYFITVSNISSTDPESVIQGNEKVMRARLNDALFFFETDQKHPIDMFLEKTKHVVFQKKLGSLFDKAQRITTLIEAIAPILKIDAKQAHEAGLLSQCDLTTDMVQEFPELQGIIGHYYAKAKGVSDAVSLSLEEQYMPRFAEDNLPSSKLGLALAWATRLDTLVGMFGIGEQPTGMKDPFKLRRYALGIVRILLSIPDYISLSSYIEQSVSVYKQQGISLSSDGIQALRPFIMDRLLSYYPGQYNIAPSILQAVLNVENEDIYDIHERCQAMHAYLGHGGSDALIQTAKRIRNILKKNGAEDIDVQPALFQEPSEKALYDVVLEIEAKIKQSPRAYPSILQTLEKLNLPIETFFEEVMIMDKDKAIQCNRLALLNRASTLLDYVSKD